METNTQATPIIQPLPNGSYINLISIQGGYFSMGSNELDDEQPIHEVTVPSFYLSQYPITNAQFLPFLQEMGNQEEDGVTWVNLEGQFENVRCGITKERGEFVCVEDSEQHPMIYVSWFGVRAYCKWLSEKTGYHYRLPSESEWEYAARGGNESNGYRYAGSNKLEEVGWYRRNSHRETKPVGMKLPNELGLYDMSGNVYEWCADYWHENYEGAPLDGSAWTNGRTARRVLRGGSWGDGDDYCRVSFRDFRNFYIRFINVGFRVAMAP